MKVRVHGQIIKNQCTTIDDIDAEKKKRKKRLVKKFKPNNTFGSKNEGSDLDKVIGDYEVNMGSNFTSEVVNFTLFE